MRTGPDSARKKVSDSRPECKQGLLSQATCGAAVAASSSLQQHRHCCRLLGQPRRHSPCRAASARTALPPPEPEHSMSLGSATARGVHCAMFSSRSVCPLGKACRHVQASAAECYSLSHRHGGGTRAPVPPRSCLTAARWRQEAARPAGAAGGCPRCAPGARPAPCRPPSPPPPAPRGLSSVLRNEEQALALRGKTPGTQQVTFGIARRSRSTKARISCSLCSKPRTFACVHLSGCWCSV